MHNRDSKRRRKRKGDVNAFEKLWLKISPNLKKETDIQIQEAQRVPKKMNPNRPTPRYIIIKMAKVKDRERILKVTREKQRVLYKGTLIRLSADFSTETLQARRQWQNILKILKEKNLQPRILYPPRLSFRIGGEMKNFSDKQNLKEYSNTKPILKEILKGHLQIEKKQKKQEGGNHNWKVNHLNQPVYRSKRKRKKPICESNDKHKEQQKDKHEDVKRDITILKCGEGE